MFISYAQNFEDVVLNRLFKDKNDGFYIDIGANHPIFDSVTMAFYERGWRGINIEPMPLYYELLCDKRRRDINLNCAVSDQDKTLDFYDLEGTGYSTLDKVVAETLVSEKNLDLTVYQVQTQSLAAIAREYVHCPIDFMKIDVEGWEKPVVLSHDWDNFRPKVLIIEATFPGKSEHLESDIEDFLRTKNYTKIYFDGLNDFYLANEFSDLGHYFGTPPNVFDDFQKFLYVDLKQHADNLEQILLARDEEIRSLNQFSNNQVNELAHLQELLKNKSDEFENLQQLVGEFEKNPLVAQQEFDNKVLILENKIESITRKNVILENYLNDEKFEVQRLKMEIKKINQLNEKHLMQLDISLNNLTAEKNSLLQNHVSLKNENQRIQETLSAVKTSKFWKLRLLWFKVKTRLGIPFKEEIMWLLILYTIIKESPYT